MNIDEKYMGLALDLAKKAEGLTAKELLAGKPVHSGYCGSSGSGWLWQICW